MYMSGRDAQSCGTVFKSPELMQVLETFLFVERTKSYTKCIFSVIKSSLSYLRPVCWGFLER